MEGDTTGSVTLHIGDLRAGGDAAAQALWERYFERLVRLARSRLRGLRAGAAEDEEDAALSAFESFCQGVGRGRFPDVTNRDDLWRLLVVITARKVMDQVRRQHAARRGGGRILGEAELVDQAEGSSEMSLEQAIGTEPSPEFAAMVAEEYRHRLDSLGDERLARVAVLKMEGRTDEEVAAMLGCTRRTVQRKLEIIRQEWRRD
jgi:DNA-directed RNA polymerase specialized sigma24 family protein